MTTENELDDLLADYENRHSAWQMDIAITARNGLTLWGCYRQAMRELHSRRRAIRRSELDLQLIAADLDELRAALEADPPESGSTEETRRTVEIRRRELDREECAEGIAETRAEMKHFAGQVRTLKRQVYDLVDGELTPETRATLEADHWSTRIQTLAALDILSGGGLGRNVVELLCCLPGADRNRILQAITGTDGETGNSLVDRLIAEGSPANLLSGPAAIEGSAGGV